jgi:RNA polymerase sigma factor (sigma-70 family)
MVSKRNIERYQCCPDEDLWTDFKEGDVQAYEFMFKKNYDLLYNYGLKITRNSEETRDCIQQLFAGLWESRLRLGYSNSIRSYLLASLRRLILRRLADKSRFVSIEGIRCEFHVEISTELKYIKNQDEIEQVRLMRDVIQKLPDRQKEALYLKYYSDHSFGEIALIMGITTRGVYKLIYKALDHLAIGVSGKKSKNHAIEPTSALILTRAFPKA